MNEINQTIFILAMQQAAAIGCGLAITYWGYSLLRIGTLKQEGGLDTASKDRRSPLRQIVPGAGFALFGFLILGFSIMRGIEIEPVGLQEPQPGDERLHALAGGTTNGAAGPLAQDSTISTVVAPSAGLPDDIKGMLKRVASGQSLAEFERKAIADWLTGVEHIPANCCDGDGRPPGEVRKKKKSPPIPVPRPGEV